MSDREMSKRAHGAADRMLAVKERRRDVRFEAAFDVRISKSDDSARRIATDAWVRNVSANGLGVSCPDPFEVGDAVTVRAPGKSLQCEVRHCRAEGAMFTIGLELLSSSDGTDIQVSLRDLSKALRFPDRTSDDLS